MNRCVYYIEGQRPSGDILPRFMRYTVCGHEAPFMVNGNSYCSDHVKEALWRDRNHNQTVAFKVLEEKP